MAQTKIYPATQTQAQTIINKLDAVDAKIVTPNYQDKTVTPSDVQQIVQADNGYNALHSVTVEPIAAAMPESLEEFIMNTAQEPYSLSLNGAVPAYACYSKTYLKRVYGNLTSIYSNAFQNCTSLESVDAPNLTSIYSYAFQNCTSLESVDMLNVTAISGSAFQNCSSLQNVNAPSLTSFNAASAHFRSCGALISADIRSMQTPYGDYIFADDANLKYVDFRNAQSITGVRIFDGCTSLSLIDLTNVFTTPGLGNVNIFQNTNNNWIAVVANDTAKAAFQSATNWSTYASHFRTIAEVEQETGMSYDDYYYQCFGHARN